MKRYLPANGVSAASFVIPRPWSGPLPPVTTNPSTCPRMAPPFPGSSGRVGPEPLLDSLQRRSERAVRLAPGRDHPPGLHHGRVIASEGGPQLGERPAEQLAREIHGDPSGQQESGAALAPPEPAGGGAEALRGGGEDVLHRQRGGRARPELAQDVDGQRLVDRPAAQAGVAEEPVERALEPADVVAEGGRHARRGPGLEDDPAHTCLL